MPDFIHRSLLLATLEGWACLAGLSQATAQLDEAQETAETLSAYVARQQHLPKGPELSAAELAMDPDEDARRRVTAAEAVDDVERFFYLLEHGYCGYGFFSHEHSFQDAQERILRDLEQRESWPTDDLAELIRRRLEFVRDCHLKLGSVQFADHQDFWFAPDLELVERDGTWYTDTPDGKCAVVSVNARDPQDFVFPSLDATGLAVHCLGVVSVSEPEPLLLDVETEGGFSERRISLQRSEYEGSELFRRFRLGGLPVVRIRTFSDHHVDEIEEFLRAAEELRGEPCVILDVRGNGGGNTRWPKEWIRSFTGQAPALNQVLTELVSRTALMGQANYMAWLASGPGRNIRDRLEGERAWLAGRLETFDANGAQPFWIAPHVPQRPPIPNRTTLVVVIDRAVASSGEGLISFLQGQVENVVLVGENTRGALVFGHNSAHRLPHSRLMAVIPVKLNVPLDMKWREERGFEPDYWVPARDALNRAVAAVRAGTIPTVKPLPREVLETEFVPESPPRFTRAEIRRLLQIVLVVMVGTVAGLANLKRGAWWFLFLATGLSVGGLVGFDDNPPARILALVLAAGNGGIAVAKLCRDRRLVGTKP